ncbi:MAG: hypothetical protein M3209_12375 [Acidobacteriota bacterium]|nr:hypothetical protein [Acidobacteriota bacterium]
MTEQQLFANYELDNSKWLAIILKFLGGSLVVHLILLLSAVYVPVVRDAFYVAMLFSDSDLKTTNKDYSLEEIGDVTMINLADPNRFRYPEGYFNTGEYVENPMDPTILAVNGGMTDMTTAPPIFDPAVPAPTPFPTPFPTPAASASGIPSIVNNPPVTRSRNRRRGGGLPPAPTPIPGAKMESLTGEADEPKKPDANQNANAEAKPTPDKNATALLSEEEINKKPLIDFGVKVDQLQKAKKVDLNQPFAVTVEGELEKGGKLVAPNVTRKDGDQQLVELTKELIAVLNASGVLKTLSDVALKDSPTQKHKIKFDVSNDEKNLMVNVSFELANAEVAYRIQSGVNALIALNKMQRKDKIEGQILQNVRAESDGNLIVLKTLMPRQDAQKLIQDQLSAAVKGQQEVTKQ